MLIIVCMKNLIDYLYLIIYYNFLRLNYFLKFVDTYNDFYAIIAFVFSLQLFSSS